MTDPKTDPVLGELASLRDRRVTLHEKELAHLGELAELLAEEAGEEEIFFRDRAFLARYRSLTRTEAPTQVDPANAFRVTEQETHLSVMRRVWLCARLCQLLGIEGKDGVGTFFDEMSAPTGSTVSYLKSSYADEAYAVFSASLDGAKVLYGGDFTQVCENVYYGRCAYGILPIENSADGALAGFRALIVKYGLKIVRLCRVALSSDEETVFALVTRSLLLPEGTEICFDLRVDCGGRLSELLTAASACGMTVESLTSVPGGRREYDLTLGVREEYICGFLAFLHLEFLNFIPIGLYGRSV